MPQLLDVTKPMQLDVADDNGPTKVRYITGGLAGDFPLLFAYGDNDAYLVRTDLNGNSEPGMGHSVINSPNNCWINVYRKQDGKMYVGQPKATKEEAVASLARNAPNTMTYIKTIEIVF